MKCRYLGKMDRQFLRLTRTRVQTGEQNLGGKLVNYVRPRFLFTIVLLVMTMGTVAGADCWDDSLKLVDKDIIVMASGAVYRVIPRDVMNSAFWLPPANTTICDSIADVGGTQMTYFQIFNRDLAVSVWAERER